MRAVSKRKGKSKRGSLKRQSGFPEDAPPRADRSGVDAAAGNSRKAGSTPDADARTPSAGLSSWVAAVFLAAAFCGAALWFEPAADASFDAPKRLISLFAIAAAALAAFGFHSEPDRTQTPDPVAGTGPRAAPWTAWYNWRDRRLILALTAAALVLGLLSALASPHRPLALDCLRVAAITALVLPLGASPSVARRLPFLLSAFFAAAAIDAVVSILQARGLYQPFSLMTQAAREATGAFAGNVGYLALALALAGVAALGLALTTRRRVLRAAAAALALLFVGALVVNQNLTSLSAFGAGVTVLLFGLFGRRAAVALAAGVLLVALAVAAYAPMRQRAGLALHAVRAGDWDALLSYRTAPWKSAVRMARDRPLLGYGPGTFGAEFVSHRLEADLASRRRLINPLTTSTYGEAHCDYLQPFAEAGIPAGLALLAAKALLLAGLVRRMGRTSGPARTEAVLLLAVLAAGATAALTWFPFQRPITAIVLLFAAGRAWRLLAPAAVTPAPAPGAAP